MQIDPALDGRRSGAGTAPLRSASGTERVLTLGYTALNLVVSRKDGRNVRPSVNLSSLTLRQTDRQTDRQMPRRAVVQEEER